MNRQEVIAALESMANGVDPSTGARIHTPETVKALLAASSLLKGNPKFASAGAPWSADEDARLAQEFEAGMSSAQIALRHGRSSAAITARLVKLGKIDASRVKSRDRGARLAS